MNNKELTQHYSTWGDKLLQHTDVLSNIQNRRLFRPITVQLAPTETCDSDCPFCSVGNRPSGRIPWTVLAGGMKSFAELGAKSVEITGGGNPLLYRDSGRTINDVIELASNNCQLKVGVITNSENPSKWIYPCAGRMIQWIRVSLAKLDEGLGPEDFDFTGFDGKVGLSYIFHQKSRSDVLECIRRIADLWPSVKFVRLAADCTTEDSRTMEDRLGEAVAAIDKEGKFFIKDIGDNFHPFLGGCWVGMLRPYWTSTGVYICTSHVLKYRKYLDEYRLCGAEMISDAWREMNQRFASGKAPYEIDPAKCWHCYYHNNNQLLSSVINELPDRDFA